MDNKIDNPDPAFRAWVAFIIPSLLLFVVFGSALQVVLNLAWDSLGVDQDRSVGGTQFLIFLFLLPVSFWCFRRALHRHVYGVDTSNYSHAANRTMQTDGGFAATADRPNR
jgi:hypothetical protein